MHKGISHPMVMKMLSIVSNTFFQIEMYHALFFKHKKMASVAEILMNCKDNPEIRGWGIDLFARTCNREDLIRVTGQLENETDVSVQQEIIAALTKFLRFRYKSDAEKYIVTSALDGFSGAIANTNSNLGNAVKMLNEELGYYFK